MAQPQAGALDEVADRLYGQRPAAFIPARDAAAKAAGDRELAAAIRALRRPTVAAWVVNSLVRARRDDVDALLALGGELRNAMAEDPAQVRALVERRRTAITKLGRAGAELADRAGHPLPASAQEAVAATLEAATADPDIGDDVRRGWLVKERTYAGFGPGFPASTGSPEASAKPAASAKRPAAARKPPRPPAAPKPRESPAPSTPAKRRARDEAALRRAEAAYDDARGAAETALRAVADARAALARAERAVTAAQARLARAEQAAAEQRTRRQQAHAALQAAKRG